MFIPRQRFLWVTTILLSVASATFAHAEALDSPHISFGNTGTNYIEVDITADGSGAPAGFRLQWMTQSDFNALGGWPDASDPRVAQADFRGVPTLATSSAPGGFKLAAFESAPVLSGSLHDESGMTPADPEAVAELVDNTAYVFRVKALAWGTKSESEWSWTMPMSTRHEENCTRSYGYWKTHQGAWPVSSAKMGTVTYNGPQILAVFTKAPAGNGFLILAHQLLAARLNIAQGAVPTSDVVSAIAAADALIGGLVCPPVGTGVLAPASVTSLIGTLTNFNEGDNGVKQCTTVATRTSTWGGLKLLYR